MLLRYYFLLFVALASLNAHAFKVVAKPNSEILIPAYNDPNFIIKLRNLQTQNSLVSITLKSARVVELESVQVKLANKNNDQKIQYSYPAGVENLDILISLPFGSGEYSVELFTCEKEKTVCYGLALPFAITNYDNVDRRFLLPAPDVESMDARIQGLAKQITQNLKTDYDKVFAIHKWISSNISYDVNKYEEYYLLKTEPVPRRSSLDTLQKRTSVCQGYANLATAMLRAIGIRSKVVTGPASSTQAIESVCSDKNLAHAWNEALVDGRRMPFDATWDSGYVSSDKPMVFTQNYNLKYFGNSADFSRTHYKCVEK